ncbi:PIN domain nuclease [Agrobacterium rubi]|uniref:type II toxin-antitoxin system VapC family toxin n=1 Tax=Agrobacterium rubi TaxID=28099 RepID=UPI001573F580|nr:PIN domain nuclease [Agrobacterium rubi]NTF06950.1 PIN domain nuclease [Agrobacterium rubi]NTF19192.1 PIN domain nuclease [Agrobacterium rubi]NTF26155.1 PIN domain nuclease [Agrobacterium rubi]
MIVIDSSVWISILRGTPTAQTEKFHAIPRLRDILLGDVVLLEILQGAQSDQHAANMQARMTKFQVVSMLSPALAIKAAQNYRYLRQRGITIRKTTDLIIGTYCIEHGHALLHSDRDFTPMAEHLGLRIA